MIKRLKPIFAILFATTILCSASVFANAEQPKLQLYFSPGIMNDTNGEIKVDVNMRNFDVAVSKSLGKVCAVTFSFEYDIQQFNIMTEDNLPKVILDDKSLVKNKADIESKIEDNSITFTYMDSTLEDNLIDKDGTLFSFMLVSTNPKSLWNSFDKYPLRFKADSIGVVTYSDTYTVGKVFNVEGIDINVGGYNIAPTLAAKSVGKKITFTKDELNVKVDDFTQDTDVSPYIQNGEMMIPVRYLTENLGMSVEWNGDILTAAAYAEYKTLKIDMKTKSIFVNSAKVYKDSGETVKPEELNDRIFVPVSLVKDLYPNSTITTSDNTVTIYVP